MIKTNEATRLITEMLSVSDEVTATSDRIYTDIENNIRNYPYQKIKGGLFIMHTGSEIYQLKGYDVMVDVTIYDFANEELFEKGIGKFRHVNRFDPDTHTLTLTLVAYLMTIYRPSSEDAIHRELEYIYQRNLNRSNNLCYLVLKNAAYNYATTILNYSNIETECKLARAMCYATPHEQDAIANEYYVQSKHSLQKFLFGETEADEVMTQFESIAEWLQANINNPKVRQDMKAYQKFGYTPDNIMTYVEKGLSNFKNKLSRVRQLIDATTNDIIPISTHTPIRGCM